MVIDFSFSLEKGFARISFIDVLEMPFDSLVLYGEAKWYVVESIAAVYGDLLVNEGLRRPDLYNWLFERYDDEVSFFVIEAGANILNSAGRTNGLVRVYFGEKGFIIAFEQVDSFFNAKKVDSERLITCKGGGFSFFRNCKGLVFFNDAELVRCIYYAYFFE